MTSPYIRSLPLRWSVSLVVCAACVTATWFASAYAQGELHKTSLVTRWGASVTAANAWTEYPRPQLQRDGLAESEWSLGLRHHRRSTSTPHRRTWGGNILVPFCAGNKAGRRAAGCWSQIEALWYRRSFDLSTGTGKRTLLNFEAVDYRCEVVGERNRRWKPPRGQHAVQRWTSRRPPTSGRMNWWCASRTRPKATSCAGNRCSSQRASGIRAFPASGRRFGWNKWLQGISRICTSRPTPPKAPSPLLRTSWGVRLKDLHAA
jgi:hypothetical protein